MSSDLQQHPPSVMTTGRWLCTRCYRAGRLVTSETGTGQCPVCGGESYQPEYRTQTTEVQTA